ncbi:MAG TPA: enoyl-CoA hydratase/isomerase family protein [Baekduia sp.]|nr:enoyl-CoA hydratase/isomerase family protein [Baekduia sp.]
MNPTPQNCQVVRDGRVLEIAIARPEARNALDYATVAELTAHLRAADSDPEVGAVLLYGDGPCFCSGGDLREFEAGVGQTAYEYHRTGEAWATLMRLVPSLTVPVVMAPHKYALAGGTGIVASADIAITAEGTQFGMPEIRIGLFPAIIFGTVVHAIGPSAARELALTARRFDADEALRLGLVHRVVAPEDLLDIARSTAEEVAGFGADVLRLAKEYMRTATELGVDAATRHGQAVRGAFMETDDFRAGVARFTSKPN